jgi:hypothetical protein
VSKNGDISLPLVPNQALYQAEPQPELIVNPARQRGARPYFACFATPGKQFALCRNRGRIFAGNNATLVACAVISGG